jgi:hypothetical protein
MRSITPATNNTRQTGARYASAPRLGGSHSAANEHQHSTRSVTPNRYVSSFDHQDLSTPPDQRTPSSTGLIRLSLKKPMGIVFEPMYDPNQKSLQRGVRICDLPRTGAAALSRKLQVGDELLQINDKTVSRLNFDQIMDYIIEADPESVNLLFRRPRKETLQARQGVAQKLNAVANKDNPSTVKWEDEDPKPDVKKTKDRKSEKKESKKSKRSKRGSVSEDDVETLQSSTIGDDSYTRPTETRRKKGGAKAKRNPYESESFLDLLIDTICSNSNNVCRDTFRRAEEEPMSPMMNLSIHATRQQERSAAKNRKTTHYQVKVQRKSRVVKKSTINQKKRWRRRNMKTTEHWNRSAVRIDQSKMLQQVPLLVWLLNRYLLWSLLSLT